MDIAKKAPGFVIFGSLGLIISGALVSATYLENTLLVLWGALLAMMGMFVLLELAIEWNI
jgi:hypothetical protein